MTVRPLSLAALTLVLAATASQAGWSFGFSVAGPYRPYYRPYPYYRPAVVIAPAYPIYVTPAPVVVRPVVALPGYQAEYEPAVPAVPDADPVAARPAVVPVAAKAAVDLSALNDPSPKARADAAIHIGRQKDRRGVKALARSLREDKSIDVREAAARALGLIGDPAALPALQQAAQADDDRDVRRSASFAAEVIRANMRR